MIVSFCIVAHNEEKNMPAIFDMIMAQDYPHEKIEIIFVDSMSTDKTKKYMDEFVAKARGFYNSKVIENEKIKQAPGWNIAIQNASGDVIIRFDAHGCAPPDFVSRRVRVIKDGEYVAGGPCHRIVDEQTKWKETLSTAESSMFGSGIAPYRRNSTRTYVKSISHGIYRREVFDKTGGFNEKLGRTEDNEMHYRIRKSGYRICFEPSCISYHHTRSSLKAMLKQKYGNGFWIGRTIGICPKCFSIFHFVPAIFVLSILASLILATIGCPIFIILLTVLYGIANIIMTITSIFKKNFWIGDIFLPIIFILLHFSYGIGTIWGLISMPRWRHVVYLKKE
ncbi:glycosyltransferase [Avibacterium avium]|uniref:Cellulose synthase/poly-beta-1,6-N-acetylglucosamine synthase-like glycosyltransferase n=1 Tax=Avibacterium gallinarum TaxID=755 RepID=A0A379AWX2_AVIGA|nr:glycosyltransferase [Avibacterium gallinarum]POY44472.1 glycosyltransferase [Avibacterium gallinarum]TDP30249.1 cellulose synthase/poly-beta-1,6-N-acetylglucosamine synthase-like glycosyltransferase [Avibacterium gallinarum]SUB26749.1 glycosyl transferase, family 2 protein [Avibacterium gallinarum]